MSFVIRTLSDTWFKELPLEKAALEPWRIPSDKSLAERSAVVDERNKILFTELISAGYEQRDGYRHFVLAAGLDLYLFYSDAGKVKFMQQESARNYPRLSSRPPSFGSKRLTTGQSSLFDAHPINAATNTLHFG